MSSYKAIDTIKYHDESDSPVSLVQYTIFDDEVDRFIIFKFRNNLNQSLSTLKFEVKEYDQNNQLIKKSIIKYDSKVFVGETDEETSEFLCKGKFVIDSNTNYVKVNVLEAKFLTVEYVDGKYEDIVYTREQFNNISKEEKKKETKKTATKKIKTKVTRREKKENKKLRKNKIVVTNYSRLTKVSIFMRVLCLVGLLLGTVGLFIYFKTVNHTYYADGFYYELNGDYVTITKYESSYFKNEEVVIPEKINKREVTKISENAFAWTNVKTVTINASNVSLENGAFRNARYLVNFSTDSNCNLTIGAYTFENCTNLTSVNISNATSINEYTFKNCTSLYSLNLPDARLETNSLAGIPNLKELTYGSTSIYTQVYQLFGNKYSYPKSLLSISTYMGTISNVYFDYCDSLKTVTLLNSYAYVDSSVYTKYKEIYFIKK